MDFKDIIIPSVTTLLGYFLGYRRQIKETDSIQIENIAKSLEIYQSIIDDLKIRITELQNRVYEMDENISQLRKENQNLKELLERHESRGN